MNNVIKLAVVTDPGTDRAILSSDAPFPPNVGIGSKVDFDSAQDVSEKTALSGAQSPNNASSVNRIKPGNRFIPDEHGLYDIEPVSAEARMLSQAAKALINSGRAFVDDSEQLPQLEEDPDWIAFQSKSATPEEALQNDQGLRVHDYLNQLALQEERLIEKKLDYAEFKTRGSKWSRIGKSLLGAAKSVVTAIPKLVDAVLPTGMQIVPKMEMIAGQKESQARELVQAKRAYDEDVLRINSGYDAIGEYIYQNGSHCISRLDSNDSKAVHNFVVECKFEEKSPHYPAVKAKIEKKLAERKVQYEKAVAAIQNDRCALELAEQMETDLKKTSWRYRLLDKVKSFFNPAEKPAANVSAVTQLQSKPVVITSPVMNDNHQPVVQNTIIEPQEAPTTPVRKPSRWKFALAAAAGLTASSFAGSHQNSTMDRTQAIQTVAASAADSAPSVQQVRKEAVKQQLQAVQSNATKLQKETQVAKSDISIHQRNAKSVSLAGIKSYPRTTDINPGPANPNLENGQRHIPSESTDPAQKQVTEAERLAEARLLKAKIDGFSKRLTEINRDKLLIDRYANGSNSISMQNVRVPQILDSIKTRMGNLNVAADLNRVNASLAEIDRIITADEATVKTLNEAITIIPLGQAIDLLATTQKLAGSTQANFTVNHVGTGGEIVPYHVSLSEIQSRLAGIQARIRDHQSVSLEQARADKANAEYYVTALRFYNWNLQYNSNYVAMR